MNKTFRRFSSMLACITVWFVGALPLPAAAGLTDISNTPLLVAAPSSVQANLMFVLDDSGSMDFDFLPDTVGGSLCRSVGAKAATSGANASSGTFSGACCVNGNTSTTCWGALPDPSFPWASTTVSKQPRRAAPPFLAAGFNGVAYNPEVRYQPPYNADSKTAGDGTTAFKSMTSANTGGWTAVPIDAFNVQSTDTLDLTKKYPDTEWCTDTNYTDCLRNDNYVLPGTVNAKSYTTYHAQFATGTGSVATGSPEAATTNAVTFGPHYYTIIPGEYCDSTSLQNCVTASAATGAFIYPAKVRWCNTAANATANQPAAYACQATQSTAYGNVRYPTKFLSSGTPSKAGTAAVPATMSFTVTVGSCSASGNTMGVGSIAVSGTDLLGGVATTLRSKPSAATIATDIAAGINAKTGSTGYSATVSSATVTVKAPSTGPVTAAATLTKASGSTTACTLGPSPTGAFSGYVAAVPDTPAVPSGYPGSFQRVDILSGKTYTKAAARTDCAGSSCTYDEEMTNFANWWAYYHSRMQAMKSSATRAFYPLGSNRRLGYMSINNATGSDFLNPDTFDDTTPAGGFKQKTTWFSKLLKADPSGSTPLRTALSKVGRLYAGKLNGTTLNGSKVTDPMLYSCQKNYTILSTDGYWNETATPTQLDGSTYIGDQDSASSVARPYYDGTATSNTLADVAYYYYNTDLRTGDTTKSSTVCLGGTSSLVTTAQDVCGNSTDNGKTPDKVQSMVTFTLGLGTSGNMLFRPDYLTATTGDYYAVSQGSAANPNGGVCSWQTGGTCNWPSPTSNTLTTIDDLWHAAVNGHGTYVSAGSPEALETGLIRALNAVDTDTKAGAAANASNPNVVAGDNNVYVSTFTSGAWYGDLVNETIDLQTGVVDDKVAVWSAGSQLDAATWSARKIYMYAPGQPSNRKDFSWAAMSATEQANFSLSHLKTPGTGMTALSQFCTTGSYCVTSDDQTAATSTSSSGGQPLVDYLRGDRSHEGDLTQVTTWFRSRTHLLGDIINSEAVYVGKSLFNYADSGYSAFANPATPRKPMVYVAANDGMLHAFDAATGTELWAYVPTLMLPKLFQLADKSYPTQHQFFVDGTPTVQDIYDGSAWRTLLVGGFGAGGRGYYAIDITTPDNPIVMWEYSDSNLGLTLGKAEVGKTSDGKWRVFFGSGANNVSPGDGKGYLYVLDAVTGSLVRTIATNAGGVNVGSSATPSNLIHIRGWVDNGDVDNTIQRVYGGDNLGNVWRFDVNDSIAPTGYEAQRLATLFAPDGTTAQPVTSRPELGQSGTYPLVFVGTGRYLGQSDLSDSTTQTIYAIKDRMGTVDFGNPRLAANKFVAQTLTTGTCPSGSSACSSGEAIRTGSNNNVDLSVNGGWYIDLPSTRERVTTDPQLALGTLVVTSNVIASQSNVCQVGGSSWITFLDYATGRPVGSANNVASVFLADSLATRATLVKLPNGKVISVTRTTGTQTNQVPLNTDTGTTRRLSWRDLIQN